MRRSISNRFQRKKENRINVVEFLWEICKKFNIHNLGSCLSNEVKNIQDSNDRSVKRKYTIKKGKMYLSVKEVSYLYIINQVNNL